jgi:hypothetical protein
MSWGDIKNPTVVRWVASHYNLARTASIHITSRAGVDILESIAPAELTVNAK